MMIIHTKTQYSERNMKVTISHIIVSRAISDISQCTVKLELSAMSTTTT